MDAGRSLAAGIEAHRLGLGPLFESARDAVVVGEAGSGRIVLWNEAACDLFGYSRDEGCSMLLESLVPDSLKQQHLAGLARYGETGRGLLIDSGKVIEVPAVRKDKVEIRVELTLSPLMVHDLPGRYVMAVIRDVSERVRNQAALQARTEELAHSEAALREALTKLRGAEQDLRGARDALVKEHAALRQVATLVARESSPPQLFAVVAEQVARIFDVPLVRVVRYEPDGSVVVGGFSDSDDVPFPIGSRWPLDTPGVVATVRETARPARVEDYAQTRGEGAAIARAAGMRLAVAGPIVVEGRLWGAMVLLSPRPELLPKDTEVRLSDFTELVATAISNAEARRDLEQLAAEQQALRRAATLVASGASPIEVFAAITASASELFNTPFASLLRYESNETATMVAGCEACSTYVGQAWTVPADDPGIVRIVVSTCLPARIEDHSGVHGPLGEAARALGVGSVVGVPVIVDGAVWGVLAVGATQDGPALPADADDRLVGFTELVTTAIANSDAREDVRRLLEEQAALRRVATLVARGAGAGEIFSMVADEVGRLFGSEVAIARFEPDGSAMVVVGLTPGIPVVSIGTRWELKEFLASTQVYRTGRPARNDHTGHRDATGPEADSLRTMNFVSTVAAPIVVEGDLWGVMTLSDSRKLLPQDTEVRVEKFTDLLATAMANAESRDQLASSEARAHELADEQAALRRVATLIAKGANADALFAAVAREVAGVVGIPVVGVQRYEADRTFTMLGLAGDTTFTVGSRWPVQDEGIAGMILATGLPARKEDYSTMPGPLGDAIREDRMVSTVGVPIVVEGSIWGFMVVAGRPGDSIPADTEDRLARFTELIATAVSNATIRADLLASRTRVLAAADDARRRIERDLHDGAQQRLVNLGVELRNVEAQFPPGLDEVRAEIGHVAEGMADALDELREMSRGIHPAILSEGGLSPALKALGRRSAVSVEFDVGFDHRLPDQIEVAAYFIVSEALTNASKHASTVRAWVSLRMEQDTLHLSIRDEGVGGADPSGGSGLIGLRDRVEALGGTIEVDSPPGRGTRIHVAIPISRDHPIDSLGRAVQRPGAPR